MNVLIEISSWGGSGASDRWVVHLRKKIFAPSSRICPDSSLGGAGHLAYRFRTSLPFELRRDFSVRPPSVLEDTSWISRKCRTLWSCKSCLDHRVLIGCPPSGRVALCGNRLFSHSLASEAPISIPEHCNPCVCRVASVRDCIVFLVGTVRNLDKRSSDSMDGILVCWMELQLDRTCEWRSANCGVRILRVFPISRFQSDSSA